MQRSYIPLTCQLSGTHEDRTLNFGLDIVVISGVSIFICHIYDLAGAWLGMHVPQEGPPQCREPIHHAFVVFEVHPKVDSVQTMLITSLFLVTRITRTVSVRPQKSSRPTSYIDAHERSTPCLGNSSCLSCDTLFYGALLLTGLR
jgi:hypothetical protein